ncbi:MAG TPA: DUF2252 family protein [Candidatus Acidoferrum sp.]|nr:DUF2252 family protein [Candidatus Acidoferrum sp.]
MKEAQPEKTLPPIGAASEDFERWVAAQTTIVRGDLELKHRLMAERLFPFLRATFYRWAQWWPQICPELARAPQVLAVGDLHVDNFGTWRDLEGRLVWGVNDFDEAWPAAYTADLVRLVTSAYLAGTEEQLLVSRRTAREAIEDGYRDSMEKGGSPYVLAERHVWLRDIALSKLRDPVRFWKKVETLPAFRGPVPPLVHELLRGCMPVKDAAMRMKTRVAGLGSLGKPRILALFEWHGAHVLREAKALTRSAWIWADAGRDRAKDKDAPLQQEAIICNAVRVRDPHLHFHENWVIRRLAPDCCRIDVASLPDNRDEERMLYAMGWETANVHLGNRDKVGAVRKDLAARRGKWLHKAAKAMAEATEKDWRAWRKSWRKNHAKG